MEIKEVFDAVPASVAEFMATTGQGFYVPAYQREYSWDKSPHIERLLDDVSHGVAQLIDRDDAMTFIGTLITIHDNEYKTVMPFVRQQMPSKVMTVIDGQQRLTTLMLLAAALHDALRLAHRSLEGSDDVADVWAHERCVETLAELLRTLQEDMNYGDDGYRFYPRMIRAYKDTWSRKSKEARYESPVAAFLWKFGDHQRGPSSAKYVPGGDQVLNDRFEYLRKMLRDYVARAKADGPVEFPSVSRIMSSDGLVKNLFREDKLPSEVSERLSSPDDDDYSELFRVLVFARFVLRRVAVTVVTVKTEDYAFDMFDALNTTGEPLTAIETFIPRVIEAEGIGHFEGSESESALEPVRKYVGQFSKAADRQQATTTLLIPFRLAEQGLPLTRRLNDQRRFLLDAYAAKRDDLDSQRRFVRHLSHVALFVENAWDVENSIELPAVKLSEASKMCLAVLRSAKHDIVIAPLSRFYSAVRTSADAGAKKAFEEAIQAVTAFSTLWRGAKGGTAGIDAVYRRLMRSGDEEVDVPPLARVPAGAEEQVEVDSSSLKKYFRKQLEKAGIASEAEWVQLASQVPTYSASQPLTRFLLLAAMHDTVPDGAAPGLVKQGRSGVLDLLNLSRWSDEKTITVEHVAPQTRDPNSDWQEELYLQRGLIDRLGNLILLSLGDNSMVGNENWSTKRAVFRVLSARSPDEAETAFLEADADGIQLKEGLLEREEYLPLAGAVGEYSGSWDEEMIRNRSIRLAQLAWKRLAPWLQMS